VRDHTNRPGSEFPFGGGRHRTNGTNGVHPEGMRTRGFALDEEPLDLVAVQADDELINALRSGMTVSAPGVHGYDNDDHVASILAAWKAEVDADPIPELVDIETAMATIAAASPRSVVRRTGRHLAPVAAAAAFVVLALAGVSIGSADSEPGDALWGVSKVLYSERAESVEAAARVETRIDSAKKALAQGQTEVAAKELLAAQSDLLVIRPQEGKADLAEVQSFLVAKADETPPGTPTDPGAPLKKDRTRKVPRGAGLTESPSPSGPATVPAPAPAVVLPVVPGGSQAPGDPLPQTEPGAATVAPTTSPAPTAGTSEVPGPPGGTVAPPTPEGGPSTTTPSQGLGGAEGQPSTSATAAGSDATVPATGTS
jgi:Anti-sigma-D factor RsdA to sigma factor binding region